LRTGNRLGAFAYRHRALIISEWFALTGADMRGRNTGGQVETVVLRTRDDAHQQQD
jgi:hypothetical protein